MKATLNNINLLAVSPETLRDFYVEVFGLEELRHISQPPGFFMLNGNGCNLSIQDAAAVGQPVGKAGIELGFEVTDVSEILARVRRSQGSVVEAGQQMGWGDAFTAADPEGHRINVYRFNRRD